MGWILAIAGTLAAAAVAAAWLRSRRRPAARAVSGSALAASDPGAPDDGAWVSRITQTIPAVVRRLADQESARPESRGGLGLQGNLAQTPLHDLLQYLSLGRKSGVLELASGRRTGRLVLSEGRIGKTAYRGKEGMEAAFLMLDLPEGDFEFYEQAAQLALGPTIQLGLGNDGPGGKPGEAGQPMEVVDVIMLWMARKPKKKQPT